MTCVARIREGLMSRILLVVGREGTRIDAGRKAGGSVALDRPETPCRF